MPTVTLIACIAGNPYKAWHGSTGPDDTEHVPDDEWQAQSHQFEDLDAAKAFIAGLHPAVTTHVELLDDDGAVIYRKDAGDDLDAAEPGVVPESEKVDAPSAIAVPDAPPIMEAQ